MPNYRLSIDLSDLYLEIEKYSLREYRLPFSLYILEADNPDDACATIMLRIMTSLMKTEHTIETRVLCRKVRKFLRVDKIECL
tara:strand:- start:5068 stop:5316 length:249 start_codon:yes stop_codon:yes gene_type:complete